MSWKTPIVFLGSLALLSVDSLTTAIAQQSYGYGGYGHGGYMHGWGDGWHNWFMGPLIMLVFLALATVVVVLIVRWLWGTGRTPHHGGPLSNTPLDILKERFARGEIDANEFEERRKILEK